MHDCGTVASDPAKIDALCAPVYFSVQASHHEVDREAIAVLSGPGLAAKGTPVVLPADRFLRVPFIDNWAELERTEQKDSLSSVDGRLSIAPCGFRIDLVATGGLEPPT